MQAKCAQYLGATSKKLGVISHQINYFFKKRRFSRKSWKFFGIFCRFVLLDAFDSSSLNKNLSMVQFLLEVYFISVRLLGTGTYDLFGSANNFENNITFFLFPVFAGHLPKITSFSTKNIKDNRYKNRKSKKPVLQ